MVWRESKASLSWKIITVALLSRHLPLRRDFQRTVCMMSNFIRVCLCHCVCRMTTGAKQKQLFSLGLGFFRSWSFCCLPPLRGNDIANSPVALTLQDKCGLCMPGHRFSLLLNSLGMITIFCSDRPGWGKVSRNLLSRLWSSPPAGRCTQRFWEKFIGKKEKMFEMQISQ